MQYVVVLSIPDEAVEGDDSIEATCSDLNELLNEANSPFTVRPLSEILAC